MIIKYDVMSFSNNGIFTNLCNSSHFYQSEEGKCVGGSVPLLLKKNTLLLKGKVNIKTA